MKPNKKFLKIIFRDRITLNRLFSSSLLNNFQFTQLHYAPASSKLTYPIPVGLLVGRSIVEGGTPFTSFWCFYCKLWTYFTPCSSVSIVNFEHVNADWDYELTHIIKTWPKDFMITSSFCLCQHFSVMTSWFLFKILAIEVSSVSTELFIVSESILPLIWKLLRSSFKISKNYGVITIHFLLT